MFFDKNKNVYRKTDNSFNILYCLNYDLNDFLTYYDFVAYSFHVITLNHNSDKQKRPLSREAFRYRILFFLV